MNISTTIADQLIRENIISQRHRIKAENAIQRSINNKEIFISREKVRYELYKLVDRRFYAAVYNPKLERLLDDVELFESEEVLSDEEVDNLIICVLDYIEACSENGTVTWLDWAADDFADQIFLPLDLDINQSQNADIFSHALDYAGFNTDDYLNIIVKYHNLDMFI